MNIYKFTGAIVAALGIFALTSVKADTEGFTTGIPTGQSGGTGITGFNFTVTQAISITQLGFYAISIGGGDTPHVSIYNVTGAPSLLGDSGTMTGMTDSSWNYVTLATPIMLVPGQTYQVTAPVYWAPQFSPAALSSFTYGSAVNSSGFYLTSGWGGWDNGTYTSPVGTTVQPQTGNVLIAADFKYTLASVPEPRTSAAAIGLGCIMLIVLRRRQMAA